jgi:hypothetical protein
MAPISLVCFEQSVRSLVVCEVLSSWDSGELVRWQYQLTEDMMHKSSERIE